MSRVISFILVLALVATGCSPTPSDAPPVTAWSPTAVTLTAPVLDVRELSEATPLAYAGGQPVRGIAQLPRISTNQGNLGVIFWGTRNASTHAIDRVTEAQVQGAGGPGGSVHVFFDAAMHPALFRDDASGYSVAIAHETPLVELVTLCDPSFTAIARTTVTRSGDSAQVGPVTSGGSCTVADSGAARSFHPDAAAKCSGDVASIEYQLCRIAPVITADSDAAGAGLALSAILKFTGRTEPRQQNPITKAVVAAFIAIALMALPTIINALVSAIIARMSITVEGVPALYIAQESLPGCSASAPAGNCPFPHPEPTPGPGGALTQSTG